MILQGDAIAVLRTMPEASVQTCVTSPPYWSLRDYGVPPTIWGGDPLCRHVWESAGTKEGYASKRKWQHSMTNEPDSNGRGEPRAAKKRSTLRSDNPDGWNQIEQGKFCATCGAWLGCLGLEPTPDLYVEHLVAVFDAVRRVLRNDGTLWLNLGDSYITDAAGRNTIDPKNVVGRRRDAERPNRSRLPGLKHKDMVGVPWMVAFALRARGWYLRSDIIWSKTNPMPESTRDRPTKSHEYLFLLAKSQTYYYDHDAIREAVTQSSINRVRQRSFWKQTGGAKDYGRTDVNANRSSRKTLENFAKSLSGGRNRRSVWTLPTKPFPGAHFATFPPRLIEPCILAGTSEHGCCSVCGAPFRRIVEQGDELIEQKALAGANKDGTYHGKATKAYDGTGAQDPSAVKARILEGMRERVTVGWKPTCRHTLRDVEPCTVLDPFSGTGTAAVVSARHGRAFVGIELNPDYIAMATKRIEASA